jgi:hypothetical protein
MPAVKALALRPSMDAIIRKIKAELGFASQAGVRISGAGKRVLRCCACSVKWPNLV